ncbi:2-methylcitrate dehydratase PrpD [Xylariaceae sp. FL1272]|nr:2-methylcitrate dehydratase PrpD [Xylariaceae sp. FL1272]
MATLQLATWATNLTYANLTAPVIDQAVKSIYNWAGCAIGGQAQSAPHIAHLTYQPFSGPSTSSILGSNGSIENSFADPQHAAFINGIASHIDDYDDTHLETIIHPAGPIASALFAVAEWKAPVTGHDFLTAFVAGVETECKLGLGVWPYHYDIGWHITSTTGSIGAAVAVGKLLSLSTEQMRAAIGIAAMQVIGMQVDFGSMTKSFHVGRAAQSGMLAALLAGNNYTMALDGLEGEYGWLSVVSKDNNVTEYFEQLGEVWETEKNTFKPYPCGIVLHPAINAAVNLHNETVAKGKDIKDVKSIAVEGNSEVLVLTGKTDPKSGLEGKFSVYHAVGVAFLEGKATPSQFTDSAVANETVVEYRKKVNFTADDEKFSKDQATVTVEFEDGSTLSSHIEHALGSIENPLSVAQLKTKFMDQVALQIGQSRAERAYAAFTGIGNLTDVGGLRTLY